MIVVDTSALVAILTGEPEGSGFGAFLSTRTEIALSTGNAVEAHIVMNARWGREGSARLDTLLETLGVEFHDVDPLQMRLAVDAFVRFGRGSGHPAKLNYGDCFAYALARSLDAPLLFKGDDFIHTDIRSALVPA
ncbi:type II toxin-antitoxin system VapC family toxin [Aureimonas sp. ME7]|uniref:type II toxin-antitoxin system VapC family toxin n=1 Tax=Aureimonas sp. ME7 TaxID=2744252 RepID=UPI0015F4FBB4|nr:type II toxin-antitoxin system VapC family toxin [Aureimonas sp. ME7]